MSETPNLNTGEPWSESAIADLLYAVEYRNSVARTADFLCRTKEEVRAKAAELGHWLPQLEWEHSSDHPQDNPDDFTAKHEDGFARIYKQTSYSGQPPWYWTASRGVQLGSGYAGSAREAAREAERLLLGLPAADSRQSANRQNDAGDGYNPDA